MADEKELGPIVLRPRTETTHYNGEQRCVTCGRRIPLHSPPCPPTK